MIAGLGFSYYEIDACPNNYMLYWKQNSEKTVCGACGTSRWKSDELTGCQVNSKIKKISTKVLRHIPIRSRLQDCSCFVKQLYL